MRISRLIRHCGHIFLMASFLLLMYYAMDEKDAETSKYADSKHSEKVQANKNQAKQRIREKNDQKENKYSEKLNKKNDYDMNDVLSNQIVKPKPPIHGEVVVVVVASDTGNEGAIPMLGDVADTDVDTGVESLEAPDKPLENEVEDKDMLRESDVLVGDVVIDRSDDLIMQMNDSVDGLNDAFHLGESLSFDIEMEGDSPYYLPMELLPPLKKPPSERNSPGEFGHPFMVPVKVGAALAPLIAHGFEQHGFNTIVSDIISVHRNLGDKREEQCKEKRYKKPLPSVSVIICFRNEAFSTLRRTLYSVLETVPSAVLEEIILVDDNSNQEYLKEPLKREIAELTSLVTLVRSPITLGVAKARMFGLKQARGEVVAFLDSHCECYEGWIEPLLNRIQEKRNVIATPVIEIIDQKTFEFSVTPMQLVQRGGFDWTLTYRWIAPSRDRFEDPEMDMSLPISTPTISGGVFCVNREYFLEMGSYDEGMEVWGAENLEISFRIWMCGGCLEILPCSHVGHVFRNRAPEAANLQTVLTNKRRVSEVWLDEYKDIFLKRLPFAQATSGGNVTSRQQLRNALECKTFDWYLENVYPELYIPELNPLHSGAVCCKFGHTTHVCLDTHNTGIPGRLVCVDGFQKGSPTQYFEYTKQDELRQTGSRDVCLGAKGNKIEVQRCGFPVENNEMAPDIQRWEIGEDGTIMNFGTATCLTGSTNKVWLDKCDPANKIRQTWKWK